VNPSTAFGTVLADELARCGLREAVLTPGSRSAPLAFALAGLEQAGRVRLHVRIDERSAGFLALGLAKASRRPVVLACTSGTAAAQFHPAVIEADESGIPLIVVTADRPPELRGTGANQAIDQLKLYGPAVRWFCETGVPQAGPGMTAYWRSLACKAWVLAAGTAGGVPGPVHLNAAFREPLVPGTGPAGPDWPEPLAGRADGAPWTRFSAGPVERRQDGWLELDWTERGVLVCGDGDYDPRPLAELAQAAGWPVLAEPSSGARCGPNAVAGYGYLLDDPAFMAGHRPDLIISAGRPGLSRGQLAFLKGGTGPGPARHVLIAQGPGRWADPARTGTDVAAGVRLPAQAAAGGAAGASGADKADKADGVDGASRVGGAAGASGADGAGKGGWLRSWLRAGAAVQAAAGAVLAGECVTEPRLARDLAAALPGGALLWAASSLPVRDLDLQMAPRDGLRILASRGASGIDGLVSSAIGAALAHQADGGGSAAALLGDLAFLHDLPGLMLGPDEPRPDLCLVVVNNDGGGIFSLLEQAAFPAQFERLFGTPHGADLRAAARAAGVGYARLDTPGDLPAALAGRGLRILEARTSRAEGTALRARLREACAAALAAALDP
jgi:2-succinyl-5-enolpyruvyl-6-hydroxy-3-cyclohexene-1-carboxylate synthase